METSIYFKKNILILSDLGFDTNDNLKICVFDELKDHENFVLLIRNYYSLPKKYNKLGTEYYVLNNDIFMVLVPTTHCLKEEMCFFNKLIFFSERDDEIVKDIECYLKNCKINNRNQILDDNGTPSIIIIDKAVNC